MSRDDAIIHYQELSDSKRKQVIEQLIDEIKNERELEEINKFKSDMAKGFQVISLFFDAGKGQKVEMVLKNLKKEEPIDLHSKLTNLPNNKRESAIEGLIALAEELSDRKKTKEEYTDYADMLQQIKNDKEKGLNVEHPLISLLLSFNDVAINRRVSDKLN